MVQVPPVFGLDEHRAVKRAEIGAGTRWGLTSAQEVELKELRKENRELKARQRDPAVGISFLRGCFDRRSVK